MKHKKSPSKNRTFGATLIHHVMNTFVPRRHNGYHPHLIGRYGLSAITVLATAGFFFAGYQQQTAVLGSEPAITPAALLQNVNAERAKDGDKALAYNTKLAEAALQKGRNMFAAQYWAHNSPTGVTPWKWIQDQDYAYAYAGENLAKNFSSAQSTVDAWMASPTHRENMLHGYYREAGFAVVDGQLDGRPTTIVVALFATPLSAGSGVAGATATPRVGSDLGVLARAGVRVQSMNPALIGALSLSMVAMFVAVLTFATAHLNLFGRRVARTASTTGAGISWHQHHSISKMMGLAAFIMLSLLIVSGGQL